MKVSIVKCEGYANASKGVHDAIELIGGIGAFVKKGQTVLIKPNQLTAKPMEKAVTTHPAVLEAVILEVKLAGGKSIVGDSPALFDLEKVAKASGILEVCEKHSVDMVDLEAGRKISIKGRVKEFFLAKLEDFDVIINLPKLKTHSLTVFTGAVKNLFGLIPGKRKALYHLKYPDSYRFSEMLMDLYLHVKPQLTIMDGIVAMEGNGPAAGDPRPIGLILAGDDALVTDRVAAEILQMTKEIPLMRIARARGMAQINLSNIELSGENISDVIVKDFRRPAGASKMIARRIPLFIRNIFSARPFLVKENCIKCRHCHEICPASAISMRPYPEFDYEKCIRCYCCSEVCPKSAITLKKRFF